MTLLGFFEVGFGEMVVVGIVALLLFGGRLPEVMRSLGASYRSFRRGFDDLSRQALRPDLLQTTYKPSPPVPPASTKPPPATGPSDRPPAGSPAPWARAVTTPTPTPTPPAVAPAPTATAAPATPPPAPRHDDDTPFV